MESSPRREPWDGWSTQSGGAPEGSQSYTSSLSPLLVLRQVGVKPCFTAPALGYSFVPARRLTRCGLGPHWANSKLAPPCPAEDIRHPQSPWLRGCSEHSTLCLSCDTLRLQGWATSFATRPSQTMSRFPEHKNRVVAFPTGWCARVVAALYFRLPHNARSSGPAMGQSARGPGEPCGTG